MQLTLAEVVDKEAVRINLRPTQLGEDGSRSLCVLLDGRRNLLVPFPDQKLPRVRPSLADMFSDKPTKDYFNALLGYLAEINAVDWAEITFNYGFDSGNSKYKGLGVLPEDDRETVEKRLTNMHRFYLAKQYLANELNEAGLVGVAWRLKFGRPLSDLSAEDMPLHYSFCKKGDENKGSYVASIDGNRLIVNDPKYLRLFRDVCKVLNKEYGMAKIPVEAR